MLKRLGYLPFSSSGGSARTFYKESGDPDIVAFHEPHGSDTIRQGTLTEYLRRLNIDRNMFLTELDFC